jgi:hypothetical protein
LQNWGYAGIHLSLHLPAIYVDANGDSNNYTYFDTETLTDGETGVNAEAASHAATTPVTDDAVIRVYDDAADNLIETHEHKGDFREW